MTRKTGVIIVHRHERCEGSTILGVFPHTRKGMEAAEAVEAAERARVGFMRCDDVTIEGWDVARVKSARKRKP